MKCLRFWLSGENPPWHERGFIRSSFGLQARRVQRMKNNSFIHSHAPLDPEDTYATLRQQYLDELTTTERNFGEEMAMRSLKHHHYDTRPNLHRRGDIQN
jgi:hypothetical protein